MSPAHKKVFLTGATGFLASHVLELLVARGYNVKVSVRSQPKANYILAKYSGKPVEAVIVPDIQEEHAFDAALQGDKEITAVLHTASPFFAAKSDPFKELLDPAIKGTTNVLKAIKQHAPQVSQVVITSSFAAISNLDKQNDPTFVHDESVWASVTWEQATTDLSYTYRGSKKFAEKAFWDFIEQEKPNFTGTTVNPPLIYGPLVQKVDNIDKINTSSKIVYDLLHSKEAENPLSYSENLSLWVDVRDVALAHVVPLEKPVEAAGRRLFTTPGFYSNQDILDIANEHFPELKGKIPVGNPGTGKRNAGKNAQFENSKTNTFLDIKYITLEQSIVDTIKTLLDINKKHGVTL
jgi:nucleoside-diphosphate-sugar epimerase